MHWAWPVLEQVPNACNAMLAALEDFLEPTQTIVLRGQPEALAEWWERCARPYAPRRLTLAIPASAAIPAGLLAERRTSAAPVTAYVCTGLECRSPLTTLDALERELAQ